MKRLTKIDDPAYMDALRLAASNSSGSCALCPAEAAVLDHDHSTGFVRGALCGTCNSRLGTLDAWGSRWLAAAVGYLKQPMLFPYTMRPEQSRRRGRRIPDDLLQRCPECDSSKRRDAFQAGSGTCSDCVRRLSRGKISATAPVEIGTRFGALVTIRYVGQSKWKCLCDCGTEKVIYAGSLRAGLTKTCGDKDRHSKIAPPF